MCGWFQNLLLVLAPQTAVFVIADSNEMSGRNNSQSVRDDVLSRDSLKESTNGFLI